MTSDRSPQTPLPDYPLGRSGTPFVHAGPRLEPRIIVFPTRMTTREVEFAPGSDLFLELGRQLDSHGCRAASVELLEGDFGDVVYVHPAFGPDAAHPMSFTEELRTEPPTALRQGSGTTGFRHGEHFSHLHASFVDDNGRTTGGHLLPGTSVGEAGMTVRLHFLSDVEWESTDDPETGFSAFSPAEPATASSMASGATMETAEGLAPSTPAAVVRIRPGVCLDTAVAQIARRAGFARARVVVGLGSTVGALLDPLDSEETGVIEVAWPAVEFTHLSGTVDRGSTRLIGEVVDVAGNVAAGAVRKKENPVAVTFELLIAGTSES